MAVCGPKIKIITINNNNMINNKTKTTENY